MQIKSFKKIVLMFEIAVISLKDSLLVLFGALFFKKTRDYSDKVIHAWALHILRLVNTKYKIFNPNGFEFATGQSYIIMSNHSSHFDIPLIYTTFPHDSIGMIAKKELFRIPVFGYAMKIGGCISIDRENRQQAVKDLSMAKEKMLKGYRIWIAPEGTRSRTGKIGAFKKGGFKIALDAKAIIVPVTIVGSNKILPAKTLNFSFNEEVAVYIGKPIDTAQYQLKDMQQLMNDTKNAILLHLPEGMR